MLEGTRSRKTVKCRVIATETLFPRPLPAPTFLGSMIARLGTEEQKKGSANG